MSDDRLSTIEEKLDLLVTGQDGFRAGQDDLRAGQARIEHRLDTVEINQEEMSDRIKQIADGHGATQAAIERAATTVCAYIDHRIKPLEKAVREHLEAS